MEPELWDMEEEDGQVDEASESLVGSVLERYSIRNGFEKRRGSR